MTISEVDRQDLESTPEIVRITESDEIGRWVLAEIRTGDVSSFELTFSPDITREEWAAFRKELPFDATVYQLESVGGDLLGIPMALQALIA
ncbi:hypothetical protein [Dactylosporangium sp. CA-139066]|uniref:hypothetical protein n=1 Tax=Dactylosporangium sp. CA-139066 TaxID=3239930 RepID=UPI003D8F1635